MALEHLQEKTGFDNPLGMTGTLALLAVPHHVIDCCYVVDLQPWAGNTGLAAVLLIIAITMYNVIHMQSLQSIMMHKIKQQYW